ncbi:extracellular matrix protein FRAS1-like, partial [Notothenia coriiceps]|uniref:Extracellular matrix protein FRAS1-like n=1 Tax=Notothenia coriiceps TaxID=8208 RepID=A0A6I9PGH2_9TELE
MIKGQTPSADQDNSGMIKGSGAAAGWALCEDFVCLSGTKTTDTPPRSSVTGVKSLNKTLNSPPETELSNSQRAGQLTQPESVTGNNTSWRPQSCQECTCYSDVAICRPTYCPNPECDIQRGERLRIPANQCCPECISSSQGSCQYEGVIYAHDSQWSPSPCTACVCSRGSVSCTPHPCSPLSCPSDQSPFTPAGECCPKCGRNGESCSWQGTAYRDGEEWKPSLCSRCVCSNGEVRCSVAECQQVACKPHENLVIQPGRCCPQCVSNPCLSAGKQHQHGEQWQKNACTTCVCDRGQSKCHTHACQPASCAK